MASSSTDRAQFADMVLDRAKACLVNEDYGHAFANFLMLLKLSPGIQRVVKEEFAVSLDKWVEQLHQRDQTKDAFWCYEQALDVWPENDVTLHSMGAFLFKLGFPDEAASYIRKAVDINPGNASAKDSLQSIANSVVERWHFRMLNDTTRNARYREAIQRAVKMGHDVVLDIGSGTGLLSMFSVQSGAKSVYACEMSKTMYEMSHDVLRANQMADQVTVFHKKSSDLRIPQDVPHRVSLVVTETMDAGLLGEHILETLNHAWEHLLLPPPQGRVIPAGATVYGQLIECETLRKQHRLVSDRVGNLELQHNDIISKAVSGLQQPDPDDDTGFEPYTTEKLTAIPGGYRTLTPVFKIMDFDFNNPKNLKELKTSSKPSTITSEVYSSGHIDAIVTWFNLALDDCQSLSTGPGFESCWEQAVYPVHPSQLKDANPDQDQFMHVTEGDVVTVTVSCVDNHINVRCHHISHKASAKEVKGQDCNQSMKKGIQTSTSDIPHKPLGREVVKDQDSNMCNKSMRKGIQASASASGTDVDVIDFNKIDLSTSEQTAAKTNMIVLEEHDVAILNDTKTQNALLNAIRNISTEKESSFVSVGSDGDESCSVLKKLHTPQDAVSEATVGADPSGCTTRTNPGDKLSVLDLSQDLSLAGLYAAKLHHNTEICMTQPNINTQHALQCIGKGNGLVIGSNCKFVSRNEVLHPKASASWDVVMADVVEPSGVLRQNVLEDIILVRTLCLKPSGTVIPSSITMFGMCVESSSLLSDTRVLGDEQTLGINIANYINVFKSSTQLDLTLSTLTYKQLSLLFVACHVDFNQPCSLPSEGEANDTIPSSFHQTKTIMVEITQDGSLVAIPYWFVVGMDRSHHVNTMDKETHWKQAAFLLDEPVEVSKGQKVTVVATVKGSSIWFDVKR